MGIFDRIIKPSDRSEDIRARHDHDLATVDAFSKDELEAQNAFDNEGTPAPKKKLEAARKKTQSARQDAARTKRLLDGAIEREQEKHAADLERELVSLSERAKEADRHDAELAQQQAKAIIEAANIEAKRIDVIRETVAIETRRDIILAELGRSPAVRPIRDWTPSLAPVRKHTEAFLGGLDERDPRKKYVREIVPEPKPFFRSYSFAPAKGLTSMKNSEGINETESENQPSPGHHGTVSMRRGNPGIAADHNTQRKHDDAEAVLAETIDPRVQYYVGIHGVLSHRDPTKKAKILEPGAPFDLQDAGETDLRPWERLDVLLKRGLVHENPRYVAPKASTEGSE